MKRIPRCAPIARLPWIAVGLLPALPVSAAKIYRWKDTRGVTRCTDSPPQDRTHTTRSLNGQRETTAATPGQPAADANCMDARGNLRVLQGKVPVASTTTGTARPKA